MAERLLVSLPGFLHSVIRFLVVFVGWHWLPGFSNAALTAATGLGLVAAGSRWRALRLTPLNSLRLRRAILLVAAVKGATLLVVGAGFPHHARSFLVCGIQIPDPQELLGLAPRTIYSVWYFSTITTVVSRVLLGLAAVSLLLRSVQIWRAQESLHTLAKLGEERNGFQDHLILRANRALEQATRHLSLPLSHHRPPLRVVGLPGPVLLLLGIRHPCILISRHLVEQLTDAEMEIAFRHEMAHYLRRDYLWRWAVMWVADVGRITGIVGWLAASAGTIEEELCDRFAVRSATDAVLMASALTKSASTPGLDLLGKWKRALSLRATVVPSLIGQPFLWQSDIGTIRQRLEHLVRMEKERQVTALNSAIPRKMHLWTRIWNGTCHLTAVFIFGLFFFIVIYIKYITYLNIF